MTEMGSISTALSALQAQSRALQTAGNNIANASTEGYSRQRTDLSAISGPTVPALWSVSNGAGQGVAVTGVSRSSDQLLTARVVAAHGQSSLLQGKADVLSGVEDAVGEPSDTGLTESLNSLWSSFSDLSSQPGDTATRSTVLQKAGAVADALHSISAQLQTNWQNSRATIATAAADLTSSAASVARLNQQIKAAGAAGEPTADLSDKRDLLVKHMADVGGVTTIDQPDGTVSVLLAGSAIVSGSSSRGLTVGGTQDFTAAGPGSVTISWADSGTPATIPAGSLGATLDAVNTTLPAWRDRLDSVASALAATANAGQAAGFDLDHNAGAALFSGTTAATLQVAITDPRQLAASSSATGTYGAGNALTMSQLGTSTTGPDSTWRTVVADLGVASQAAQRGVDVQASVTSQADAAQTSLSGVDIDEEMTGMLQYQRAYEAAAKFMSTLDETMQSLISAVQ